MRTNNGTSSIILIIDDERQIRELLREVLYAHECVLAASAEEALTVLKEQQFDVVLSDINMPGISGLELVPRILKRSPDTVVVMVSGEQTIETAIEAMRAGAFDYVRKPLDVLHVQAAVDRAFSQHRLLVEKRLYENHLEELVKERTVALEHLAYYDPLTDLPNRNLFTERCADALATAANRNELVSVLLVSLDRFKKVAETLGHLASDAVLTHAAARLKLCVPQDFITARLEGEEFAILAVGVRDAAELTAYSAAINEAFRQLFNFGGRDIYVSVSIGISVFPTGGKDASALLMNAGAALYRAKRRGGNTHQFYAADMHVQAVKRLELESDLRRAIERHEFVTYYQPIVNLATAETVGVEALVRWQRPGSGILLPHSFIQMAEDTGLIFNIGETVLREACQQARQWQTRMGSRLSVAVNISARHFLQKDFVERVVEILIESRLDPTCLELELTETSIMENPESAARLLKQIRNLGIRVSLDDFGTGYSSLSYLKQLPIDTVK